MHVISTLAGETVCSLGFAQDCGVVRLTRATMAAGGIGESQKKFEQHARQCIRRQRECGASRQRIGLEWEQKLSSINHGNIGAVRWKRCGINLERPPEIPSQIWGRFISRTLREMEAISGEASSSMLWKILAAELGVSMEVEPFQVAELS